MTNRSFTMSRRIAATPAAVFQAWTDPEHLGWFFNPENPTDAPVEIDLRVGGRWRQLMVVDQGNQYYTGGMYRELIAGRRIVFSWGAVGGWPELDEDSPIVTIDLTGVEGGTRMDVTVELPGHLTDEAVDALIGSGMEQGWGQTIDRLVAAY